MGHMKKRHSRLLRYSMVSSVISSSALLLCFWGIQREKEIFAIIIPIVFWVGLILEQCFMWEANRIFNKFKKVRCLPGIISICKTQLGFISEIVFLVTLIGFIVLFVGRWGEQFFQYILLFFIVLSFRIHCIANGKNYRYKNNLLYERGKRHDEKSKEKRV